MAVAALRSAGYSGKSLPEKLGFKAGMNAAFIALPLEFAALADCVPFAKVVHADHWNAKLSAKTFDAIHAFTTRRIEMAANLIKLQRALKLHGMIWCPGQRRRRKFRLMSPKILFAARPLRSIWSMSKWPLSTPSGPD